MTPPAGVSQEDFNRRLAETQEKFGSTSNDLARTYITYGPPDQIESVTGGRTPAQIWRYNYLQNFHSSVEFKFTQTRGNNPAWRKDINYPAGQLYSGIPVDANPFPVRHASMEVYPAGERSKLTVPLDSLSGDIAINAEVRAISSTGTDDKVVGNLQDSLKLDGTSQSGMYGTEFMLQAGTYVCSVMVKEQATGHVFTEIINFDVK